MTRGSRRTDVTVEEQFVTTCIWCRAETDHIRSRSVERYAFLRIPGPRTGLVIHLVTCQACGGEQHVRDLVSLDSPMLAEQYARALRAAISLLDLGRGDSAARAAAVAVVQPFDPEFVDSSIDRDREDGIASELDATLGELRENCHTSIHRRWLAAMMYVADGLPGSEDTIDDLARRLTMSDRDVRAARELVTDEPRRDR